VSFKPGIFLGMLLIASLFFSCDSQVPTKQNPQETQINNKKEKQSVFSENLVPLEMQTLATTSGIEPSTIRRIMDKRKSSFKVCYKKALKKSPGIKGQVIMSFSVSPTGRVSTVKVKHATLQDEEAIDCLKRVVRHVQFPPVESGKRVTIQYPLTFAP